MGTSFQCILPPSGKLPMIRDWILFGVIIGIGVASSSHQSRVPFTINQESGCLFINATTTSESSEYFPMLLTPSSETWYEYPGRSPPSLMIATIDPHDYVVIGGEVMIPDEHTFAAALGIGPRSELVTSFESVSIQRLSETTGIMSVSEPDTHDGFVDSCVPGSLLRIRLGSNGDTFRGHFGEEMVDFQLSTSGGILSVPPSQFETISESIQSLGAMLLGENIFGNCSHARSASAELPDVTISFSNGGTLVIPPQDYLYYNGEDDICILKITRASPRDHARALYYFDPLRIPHMNVRFSSRSMELCDSIA